MEVFGILGTPWTPPGRLRTGLHELEGFFADY